MKFFGWNIQKKAEQETLLSTVEKLRKEVEIAKSTPSPSMDSIYLWVAQHAQTAPQNLSFLYKITRESDDLQTIFWNLKRELFRNGAEWSSNWQRKCEQCGKEFEFEAKECDSCKWTEMIEPDFSEIKEAKKFFKKVNLNGQSLLEVCEECEQDLETMDELVMLIFRDYLYGFDGSILSSKIKGIKRISPLVFRLLIDKQGKPGRNEVGKTVWICPEHRGTPFFDKRKGDICSQCDLQLQRAYYAAETEEEGQPNKTVYYLKEEIIFTTKYTKTKGRGFSPVLPVIHKIRALLAMDRTIELWYTKGRPLTGAIFVRSKNMEAMESMLEKIKIKQKTDPYDIPFIASDSDSKGGKLAEYVQFMNTLVEMQFIETRNEFRRAVGARFGVMPLMQGDLSQSSGLNSEGLQVTVSNRAIESGQLVFNEKVFPILCSYLGIENFSYNLLPSEEQDENAELDRKIKQAQFAQMNVTMGFDVNMDEKGEYVISGSAKNPGQFGGFNGSPSPFPSPGANDSGQRFDAEPESMQMSLEKAKDPLRLSTGFKQELLLQFEKIMKKLDYARKPTKKNLLAAVERVGDFLKERLKVVSDSELDSIYKKGIKDISKELNIGIRFGAQDREALKLLKNEKVFLDAYDGMGSSVSKKLNEIVEMAYEDPKNFSLDRIVDEMKKVSDEEEYRLARIARTETNHVSNISRMNSYFKADDGTFLYSWIGPDDHRNTKLCIELRKDTKNGVTMKELSKLVKKRSKEHGFEARGLTPHFSCRHTFIKIGEIKQKK